MRHIKKKSSLTVFVLVSSLSIILTLSSFRSSETIFSLRVKGERLAKHIIELGAIGKNLKGVTRLAFTQADILGRNYVITRMKEAGLKVRIDPAGNILGRLDGTNQHLPAILLGSHIDTVPLGGNYDGVLGVMAAIECIQVIQENDFQLKHPVEVIVFTNEEGGMTGSRAFIGELKPEVLEQVSRSGLSIRNGLQKIGGNPEKLTHAIRDPDKIKAYLELHIEQGGILESKGIDIGIVEGIVGIRWWDVIVQGFSNHAGTTPMGIRHDALLASAHLIIAVNEIAKLIAGDHVATIGRIKVLPGAPNVIPGKAEMSLELRDLSTKKIDDLFTKIQQKSKLIEKLTKTKIDFKEIDIGVRPILTNVNIKHILRESAKELTLSFNNMPSGAAHDAQNIARIAPAGMIFVPSVGGISHSPNEYTHIQDLTNGTNLLLQALLRLDSSKSKE